MPAHRLAGACANMKNGLGKPRRLQSRPSRLRPPGTGSSAPSTARLPGLKTIIVGDAAACPAGDHYLTWADLSALGGQRLATTPGAVAGRVVAIRPEDPVTVLYTSGTTGNPKGVIITHRSVLRQLAADAADATGFTAEHNRGVSYLPLAHIAERMGTIYGPVHGAGHVYFCPNPCELAATLGAVQPTAFFGVPRVWDKFQARIQAPLAAEQDPARRAAVDAAMATGRRYVRSCEFGNTTPDDLAAEFCRADEAVLRPIRFLLGLGRAATVRSAAAPLPANVAAFFAGLGMTILEVYGMTETTDFWLPSTDSELGIPRCRGRLGSPPAPPWSWRRSTRGRSC